MISPGNILIVQVGKLGDMILTTPLFREIKQLFPGSKLYVLASERNYRVAEADPYTDTVIVYPKNPLKKLLLIIKLKLLNVDIWIDTKNGYSKTSSFLLSVNKPGQSLGFNFQEPVFDTALNNYSKGSHAVDINLSPVYFFQPDAKPSRSPAINVDEDYYKVISKYINTPGFKIIFNISAGDKIRHWNTDKWVKLAGKFKNFTPGYKIYIISDSSDSGIARDIANKASDVNIQPLDLSLFEKFALISKTDAIISPDTAMIHAASAFNTAAVGLYTNVEWNLRKFAPLSEKHKVMISDNENSINSINENDVYNAVKELA